jgi:hypothetical protein
MTKFIFISFLFVSSLFAEDFPLIGGIFSETSSNPIQKAQIKTPSGSLLGTSDDKGKFEIWLSSKKIRVILTAPGFISDTINVSDLEDLFNSEFYLTPSEEEIKAATVTTKRKHQAGVDFLGTSELEGPSGMQLDLNDQLLSLPATQTQGEFSGKVIRYGSRPKDNSIALLGLKLPHLQHLDLGFPGNLSAISPRWLRGVQNSKMNSSTSPHSIELELNNAYVEDYEADFVVGSALREITISTPIGVLGFDRLSLGFKTLDSDVLQKLGETSFSENRRVGEEGNCQSPCETSLYGNRYNLNSFDISAALSGQDTAGSRDLFFTHLNDKWGIALDTSSRYRATGPGNRIDIFEGDKEQTAIVVRESWKKGPSLSIAYFNTLQNSSQKDTIGWHKTLNDTNSLILKQHHQNTEIPISYIATQTPRSWNYNLNYNYKASEDSLTIPGLSLDKDLSYSEFGLGISKDFFTSKFSAGITTQTVNYSPLSQTELLWTAWNDSTLGLGEMRLWHQSNNFSMGIQEDLEQSWNQGMQLSWNNQKSTSLDKPWKIGTSLYSQSVANPEIPTEEFKLLSNLNSAEFAWSAGAALNAEYHHIYWTFRTAMSHTSGQYSNKIAWEGNRLFESENSIRFYPVRDSMFALILRYNASIGQPQYQYKLNINNPSIEISDAKYTERYRTDIKMTVDIPQKSIFRKLRLFVELNNLFGSMDDSSLEFLGSKNLRKRGYTAEQTPAADYEYTPYLARGMGFFMQFGVEGQLGI